MMWVVFEREPAPDAPYWPGRRRLAALDATAWPAMGFWLLNELQGPARSVLPFAAVLLASIGLARVMTAVWMNHRYRFTSSWLARLTIILLIVGGVWKIMMLWR